MSTTTLAPVSVGTKLVVAKGCRARFVQKGDRGIVAAVVEGERGSARVSIQFANRVVSFYVQHKNRLADGVIGMNDGNPMHRIEVRRG